MDSKRKPIPHLSSEDEEREFGQRMTQLSILTGAKPKEIPPFLVSSRLPERFLSVYLSL